MPCAVLLKRAALLAVALNTLLPLASCANAGKAGGAPQADITRPGVGAMLDEIYASRKPVRFEQLDVSELVAKVIPVGTDKAAVLRAFAQSPTSKVVEDTPSKIVVRDDKGKAMLDPDARSVVMTFLLGADGKVAKIDAVHLKNQ